MMKPDPTNNNRSLFVVSAVAILKVYKLCISPLLGNQCRFHPSCSDYCQEAFVQHGMLRGSLLAVKRILKCHPLHSGGIDNVPPHHSKLSTNGRQA